MFVSSNAGVLDFTFATSAKMPLEELYSKGSEAAPSLRCVDICLKGAIYSAWLAMVHFRNQEPDSDGDRGALESNLVKTSAKNPAPDTGRLIIAASEAGIVPMPGAPPVVHLLLH